MLMSAACCLFSDPSSWLIGEWFTFGTNNPGTEGAPYDINFVFTD